MIATSLRRASLAIAFVGAAVPALASPSLTLTPASTHPGGSTKVSGAGFGANEAVDVYFDTSDMILEFTDASGNFGPDKLQISSSILPGSHWVTALGRKNGDGNHKALVVSTPWVSHGFTERGRRNNPYENVVDASNVSKLDLAWSAATGTYGISSSPAVGEFGSSYNPYIFVGSLNGYLYAFDSTGAKKWSQPAGGSSVAGVWSSPVVSGANVYVGGGDDKLYAFRGTTGATVAGFPVALDGFIASSPAVANGIVYIGTTNGTLYAVRASNGALVWSVTTSGASFDQSSAAVANGVVYIGSISDNKLYAFKAATGAAVSGFPVTTGFSIKSSPAIANGIVYVGSEDAYLYAFDAKNGALVWSAASGDRFNSSPAVANGVVYAGSLDHRLFAFDAKDGTELWVAATGGSYSSPAVANGVVYVEGQDDTVYAFNANGCGGGTTACPPLWSARIGGTFFSSPAVSDGMVFIGSYQDGTLSAFALNGGDDAMYRRQNAPPPSYASLHPDFRLKPVKRQN